MFTTAQSYHGSSVVLQVPGPMLKPMAPPSGGMFPPQLSPQHIAMLGGIHPHMQQFQLVRITLRARITKPGKLALERNSIKAPMRGKYS